MTIIYVLKIDLIKSEPHYVKLYSLWTVSLLKCFYFLIFMEYDLSQMSITW